MVQIPIVAIDWRTWASVWARALLDVEVAPDTDLDTAQATIKTVADALWQDADWSGTILEEPEVWGVERWTPDGIVLRAVVKTSPAEQFKVLRELRRRLVTAFRDAHIDLPHPPFAPAAVAPPPSPR